MGRQCPAMAKTSSLRGQRMTQKGPKKTKTAAAPKARKAARKAPGKAPKATAPKARMAKKAARRVQPKATTAEASAMPRKAVTPAARRRARAPPTHHADTKAEQVAEHNHQDPRLSGVAGTHAESSKV